MYQVKADGQLMFDVYCLLKMRWLISMYLARKHQFNIEDIVFIDPFNKYQNASHSAIDVKYILLNCKRIQKNMFDVISGK